MYVYIEGVGGLGNCLFQIYAALYYVDKYNYNIVLIKNKSDNTDTVLVSGTGTTKNLNSNKNTKFINYIDTIFNKFVWINHNEMINYKNVGGTPFQNCKINPEKFPGKNIRITGHCQNLDLCNHNFDLIYNYLNLTDNDIISYIKNTYGDLSDYICVCVRAGYDHPDKNYLTKNYYKKALEIYKEQNIDISKIIILSDVNNAWTNNIKLNNEYPGNIIIEPDIIQFYIGIMCKHYILSISTFHLWIAYLGIHNKPDKNVIYPTSWRLPNQLILPNWINIDTF